MADLLECLVQIRALDETSARLTHLLERSDGAAWAARPEPEVWAPVEVLAHMADTELLNGVRIRLVLTSERPPLPVFQQDELAGRAGYAGWPAELALGRFTQRRGECLELLRSCSAAELEKVGIHPERGPVTMADLVALMLAHDTTHVGQIRDRLGRAASNQRIGES